MVKHYGIKTPDKQIICSGIKKTNKKEARGRCEWFRNIYKDKNFKVMTIVSFFRD